MPKRAISVYQMQQMKFDRIDFTGRLQNSLGKPQSNGAWLIWGLSGHGKTSLQLELAKEIAKKGYRVAYNTMEEGARASFQDAIHRAAMIEVANRFIILDRESMEELFVRLEKRKSPDVVFIDSIQYAGLRKPDYIKYKERAIKLNKLLIFCSHAEGQKPEGRLACFVRYDVDVKIHVEGYRAFIISRFGGNKPYTIWQEGAETYWDEPNLSDL